MSRKYKFHDPAGVYFISFATVDRIDVLTRPVYKDIIVESLKFCQAKKGLLLNEWVIMTNQVHLLAAAGEGFSMPDIMRDLKKFTSGNIHTAIKNIRVKAGGNGCWACCDRPVFRTSRTPPSSSGSRTTIRC